MIDDTLLTSSWPATRIGEALEILAQKNGLSRTAAEVPLPPENIRARMATASEDGYQATNRWLEAVANCLNLEVEPVEAFYPEAETLVQNAAPALIGLPLANPTDTPRFLALLKGTQRSISLITPDGSLQRVQPEAIRTAICSPLEQSLAGPIDHLLEEAGIPEERNNKVRQALLKEHLNQVPIGSCWLVRLAPYANMWQQVRRAKLPRNMVSFLSIHLVQYLLFLASWVFVGRAVLNERFETGWLLGWALLLLTLIPLQLWQQWFQNKLSIESGGLLKKRLLYGALNLQPDEVKHQGAGNFLGQVMESEAVEMLALGGGFAALLALVELAIAVWVLSQGAAGIAHGVLLLLWVLFSVILSWLYYRRSRAWVKAHLRMTDDLVERMVGHRTRLAQESPETWHEMEDQFLAQYLEETTHRDKVGVYLNALVPRGWLILGLAGILYAYMTGGADPAALAITLGGILMASQALNSLVDGYSSIVDATLAWEQISPIYEAAKRAPGDTDLSSVFLIDDAEKQQRATPLMTARDLSFRFKPQGRPIFQRCNLNIYQGDRLLLEGPSGGGKSTFASLLVGLRKPESGLLLLHGLDQHSVGSQTWRRRVVAAPQFHENYVLTGTIAFNLLMGRNWPASPQDMQEAEQVCHELGLDEVISRMPSGMQQMVGEGGWQLSNGERSRIYIARALLQKAEMIILDESFAALDPINLRRSLACVLRRAPTFMVIAHP